MNQQSINKKRRIETFDLLKGIAIFMVVMGHALTMCVRGIDSAFLFKLIGQVHMPIFFFVSGYFTYKAMFKAPNLKKRFMQLIVPFLVITPLWVLYFPHSGLQSPLSHDLAGLYRSYWKDGYWFTLCLFEMSLLYYALSYALSRLKRGWMHTVLLVAVYGALIALSMAFSSEENNVDYAGVGLLTRFFPVYVMGVYAHRMKAAFDRARHNDWCVAAAIVVFALTFYCTVYPWDMPWWIQGSGSAVDSANAMLTQELSLATTPLMHLALIVIALAMVEPWGRHEYHTQGHTPGVAARYFDFLGHESLGIYLLHYFFLFPLTALQEPLKAMGLGMTPLVALSAAVAFCVIAVTLLAIYAVKRSRILAMLLTGQPLGS